MRHKRECLQAPRVGQSARAVAQMVRRGSGFNTRNAVKAACGVRRCRAFSFCALRSAGVSSQRQNSSSRARAASSHWKHRTSLRRISSHPLESLHSATHTRRDPDARGTRATTRSSEHSLRGLNSRPTIYKQRPNTTVHRPTSNTSNTCGWRVVHVDGVLRQQVCQ